jgi:hydroxymethylbilane synthase
MDTLRLACGGASWELRLASRAQRLIEAMTPGPRVTCTRIPGPLAAAILRDEADVAACAASDLPDHLPSGVVLAAILPGRDALYRCVSRSRSALSLLRPGSRVAVRDAAARAQIMALYPRLETADVRDRPDLAEGLRHDLWSAACLPREVIDEGSFWGLRVETIRPDDLLPAAGQGAIALLVAAANAAARELASAINDADARRCVSAERTFIREMERAPGCVGAAYAAASGKMMEFNGLVADSEGRWIAPDGARAEISFGEIVARDVADSCRELAARRQAEISSLRKASGF